MINKSDAFVQLKIYWKSIGLQLRGRIVSDIDICLERVSVKRHLMSSIYVTSFHLKLLYYLINNYNYYLIN